MTPNQIKNPSDSLQVQKAQLQNHVQQYNEPSFKQQKANQSHYLEKPSSYKVGDYVYVDQEEKLFDKSFDIKVRILNHSYFLFH